MRLTDHRYTQERHRMEVALRMIRLEARTCTIRACTGLTEDRIRNLYKSYVETTSSGSVRRRRGKSPQQTTCFIRSISAQLSASILAGVFASCGLLNSKAYAEAPDISVAALMCDGYEFYRKLYPAKAFSFEHAWFLLKSLHSGEDLSLARCLQCTSLYVSERWLLHTNACPLCRMRTVPARGVFDAASSVLQDCEPVYFAK